MALAEVLRITHNVHDNVKVVDSRVEGVDDKVEDIGDKVEDIGDKVQCVDEKVQVVMDGARGVSSQLPIHSNIHLTFRRKGGKVGCEGGKNNYPTDSKQRRRNQVFVISYPRHARCSCLNLLTGNQLKQLLRAWLSPADPSTNHNIARKAQHKGTAVWFFRGSIFVEWKSTGSLLWIHGKRAFMSASSGLAPSDRLRFFVAGSGKSVIWFVVPCLLHFGTHSSPVPPSFKILWLHAKLDQLSWPTFISISGISTSKAVTTCCFLSYPSFLLALVTSVISSIAFTRHTKTALDSQVTTL